MECYLSIHIKAGEVSKPYLIYSLYLKLSAQFYINLRSLMLLKLYGQSLRAVRQIESGYKEWLVS